MLHVSNNNILRVKHSRYRLYTIHRSYKHFEKFFSYTVTIWQQYIIIINAILLKEDVDRFKIVVGTTNAFIVFSRLDIRWMSSSRCRNKYDKSVADHHHHHRPHIIEYTNNEINTNTHSIHQIALDKMYMFTRLHTHIPNSTITIDGTWCDNVITCARSWVARCPYISKKRYY